MNNPEKRRRPRRLILALATATTIVLCTAIFVHGVHLVDPRKVDATIAQNVSIGASQDTVMRFLDAQHIPHSGYNAEFRRVYAGIDRSSVGMMKGHINIQFNFDAEGKLISYKVQELFDFL